MKNRILIVLLLITISNVFSQNKTDDLSLKNQFVPISPDNIFITEGYYNWGASILKSKDGLYHLFYSRWEKKYSFYGWLTHSEVAHATSQKPFGPWEYQETVLQSRGNNKWDAINVHNPKIKYFNDTYYLYYISTSIGGQPITDNELIEISKVGYSHPNWKVLRANQRTGVAFSTSINGPWQRMEEPLIEPSGPIITLAVNPAIDKGKDDKYYLIIKGDKPNDINRARNQAIAVSDTPIGPFRIQESPVIDYMDTEDMSIWYDKSRERFYGVFHAHTFIGLITSEDGIDWKNADESIIKLKSVELENGTLLKPDRMERPFIFSENDKPVVLSLAVKKDDESYTIFVPIKKHCN